MDSFCLQSIREIKEWENKALANINLNLKEKKLLRFYYF